MYEEFLSKVSILGEFGKIAWRIIEVLVTVKENLLYYIRTAPVINSLFPN